MPVRTPTEEKPVKRDDDDQPGCLVKCCRILVGGTWLLVRFSRPDGLVAVQRLGRVVSRWLRKHDRAAHRFFAYM